MKKSRLSQPVSVLDLAAYLLANYFRNTAIDAWKVHKLAYYCQAWSLVREEQPFFNEKVFASAKGILIHELVPQHSRQLYVGGSSIGNLNHLSIRQVEVIDFVMKRYGALASEELDLLVRSEAPWIKARGKLGHGDKAVEIELDTMLAHFSSKLG